MSEPSVTPQPHLYGMPHAEEGMQIDPAAVYENEIEPYIDDDRTDLSTRTPRVIEEWTTRPASDNLPHIDIVLEWIAECAGDNGGMEGMFESWGNAFAHDYVRTAMQAALNLAASKVSFFIADEKVADHAITWDANGEPLLDGEPLYVKGEVGS